jgi:RimJ/RimL family protein N-acetyltransferase
VIELPLDTARLRIRPFQPAADAAPLHKTDLDRVVAFAFEANVPSTTVMRKAGMRFDGRVDYRGHEAVRYVVERPA